MEESGWKLVHGDVFRPPQYPMILSSLLGSGIQLFCMILIVICEWAFGAGVGRGKQHRPESEEWASLPGAEGFVSISGPDRSICPSRRAGPLSHRPWCFAPQIFPAPTATPAVKPRISTGRLASFCSQALYDLHLSTPGLDWNQVSFLRKHPPNDYIVVIGSTEVSLPTFLFLLTYNNCCTPLNPS